MARTVKRGLSYTFLPVDFFDDIKIQRLVKRTHMVVAPLVYQAFLCMIYKEGYYLRWNEDLAFFAGQKVGVDEADVLTILMECLELELFSKRMFENEGILTSHGIQVYYNDTCTTAKKKDRVVEYSLLEINSERMAISPEEKAISPEGMRISSEVIPRREEKRKEKNNSSSLSPLPASEDEKTEEEQEESFMSILFFRNVREPAKELSRIKAYNSTKGREWAKMTYEQRKCMVEAWKPKSGEGRVCRTFLQAWHSIYLKAKMSGAPPDIVQQMLDKRISGVIRGDTYVISCTDMVREHIERNLENYQSTLKALKDSAGSRQLKYSILNRDYDDTG